MSARADVPASVLSAGDVLPAIPLVSASTGAEVSLRGGRGPRVLLVPHDAGCAACLGWLQRIVSDGRAIEDWGARIDLLVRQSAARAVALQAAVPPGVRVLRDDKHALAVPAGSLVIADEWGEVYFAVGIGADHDLPGADELAEWARFVAVQCPECEQAEGPWRSL